MRQAHPFDRVAHHDGRVRLAYVNRVRSIEYSEGAPCRASRYTVGTCRPHLPAGVHSAAPDAAVPCRPRVASAYARKNNAPSRASRRGVGWGWPSFIADQGQRLAASYAGGERPPPPTGTSPRRFSTWRSGLSALRRGPDMAPPLVSVSVAL